MSGDLERNGPEHGDPERDGTQGKGAVIRDDPMIAAEWALGLLEGEELLAARGKHSVDPDFAWRKEWWDNWFAPLSDEITAAEPSPQVWDRINAAIAPAHPAQSGAEVVELHARLRRWRWISVLTSAAAAIALVFVFASPPEPLPPGSSDNAPPLVASVPIGDAGLRLDVTYIPDTERMLVTAIGLTADGVHDHELWLVPPDGSALQSLGVVAPGEVRSMALPDDIRQNVAAGAALVLTREPLGGKPANAEAGPVVAEGAFAPV